MGSLGWSLDRGAVQIAMRKRVLVTSCSVLQLQSVGDGAVYGTDVAQVIHRVDLQAAAGECVARLSGNKRQLVSAGRFTLLSYKHMDR